MIENTRSVVAYGTAVVGYDLLTGNVDARATDSRVICGVACLGGGAVGDCGFELWIDNNKVGTYFNTSTALAPDKQKDIIDANTYVKAGALIQAKVIDAAPSGSIVCHIEFSRPQKTFSRRGYTRRPAAARRSAPTRRF